MRLRDLPGLALGVALSWHALAADEEPLLRHRAAIGIERPGAFVQLPLPVGAYARIQQAGLGDLRVVDARGENVPFALLAPRPDEAQRSERLTERPLFALPPRPAGSDAWPTPLELTVDGDRISVKRRPGAAAPAARPPGWVFDLGDPVERKAGEPLPQALDLQWSGPAEFSVGYRLEHSDDLRQWRPAGAGQLLALGSPEGALTQPRVALPAEPARFVRLVWSDPAAAPALTAARSVTLEQRAVVLDEPTELQQAPGTEPPPRDPKEAAPPRSLHFDLGAVLPIVQLDLPLPAGTQVAPVRLQVRERADQPWQPLAGAVFYRIERDGELSRSPPLAVQQRARYVRVVPDPRSGALDPARTTLVVRAQLSSLVFAAQGQPPYALLAGSAQARAGALPLATLVPALADERPRFGRATLGEWAESEDAARQAEADERRDALRRWLLWAVLLGGVGALGWMVWRLARGAARPAG